MGFDPSSPTGIVYALRWRAGPVAVAACGLVAAVADVVLSGLPTLGAARHGVFFPLRWDGDLAHHAKAGNVLKNVSSHRLILQSYNVVFGSWVIALVAVDVDDVVAVVIAVNHASVNQSVYTTLQKIILIPPHVGAKVYIDGHVIARLPALGVGGRGDTGSARENSYGVIVGVGFFGESEAQAGRAVRHPDKAGAFVVIPTRGCQIRNGEVYCALHEVILHSYPCQRNSEKRRGLGLTATAKRKPGTSRRV